MSFSLIPQSLKVQRFDTRTQARLRLFYLIPMYILMIIVLFPAGMVALVYDMVQMTAQAVSRAWNHEFGRMTTSDLRSLFVD